jgi:hypothetical protein
VGAQLGQEEDDARVDGELGGVRLAGHVLEDQKVGDVGIVYGDVDLRSVEGGERLLHNRPWRCLCV